MADESHCTGLALRFCERMSQAGCLCKAEKSMKVSGSQVTKLKSFSGTYEGSSQHRQTGGATLPATYAGDGSWQNHPTMDSTRGTLLPIAASLRLKADEARCGWSVKSLGDG